MTPLTLTRSTILTALRAALKPLPFVQAMWESEPVAFGRVDEWSDCDFHPSSFFLHP